MLILLMKPVLLQKGRQPFSYWRGYIQHIFISGLQEWARPLAYNVVSLQASCQQLPRPAVGQSPRLVLGPVYPLVAFFPDLFTTILGAGRHGAVLTTTLAALDIGKSTSRSSKLMRLGSYGSDAGSSACTEWRVGEVGVRRS